MRFSGLLLLWLTLVGCHGWGPPSGASLDTAAISRHDPQPWPVPPAAAASSAAIANPLVVRANDSEFFWNQLVDTVDDYFSIATERRVQNIGGLATEGFVETKCQPGATWLEPWHWDSASADERSLATLQSIRRKAVVRVVPVQGSYQVFVQVAKELEDVNRPVLATPGAATRRHDNSLVRLVAARDVESITLGWIQIGRDVALEQAILSDLQGRLAVP